MNSRELTIQLAQALGVPLNCRRAVLILEGGKEPVLQLDLILTDPKGRAILVQPSGEQMAKDIASVQFMLRLCPFKEQTE